MIGRILPIPASYTGGKKPFDSPKRVKNSGQLAKRLTIAGWISQISLATLVLLLI
jgi:hypothetical protein